MGIAAYNRGSQCIANQIAEQYPIRDAAFVAMDRINVMPKKALPASEILRGKRRPLLDKYAIQKDTNSDTWMMMDPDDMYEGYSKWYRSLEDVITSWDDLYLTEYDYSTKIWTAEVTS